MNVVNARDRAFKENTIYKENNKKVTSEHGEGRARKEVYENLTLTHRVY